MGVVIGQLHPRIDSPAKIRGLALYAPDEAVRHPAWGFLTTSFIARRRVTGFDLAEALALPGVIDILTYEDVVDKAKPPKQQSGGATTTTMRDDRVWHDGQIIGMVLADTYEIARVGVPGPRSLSRRAAGGDLRLGGRRRTTRSSCSPPPPNVTAAS